MCIRDSVQTGQSEGVAATGDNRSLIISLAVISLAGMIALTVSIGKEQRQENEPKSYHEAE